MVSKRVFASGAAVVGLALLAQVTAAGGAAHAAAPQGSRRIEVVRLPEGGFQPQAAVDGKGVIHVVYLKGEAGAADPYYTRREGDHWMPPLRVSSRPGAAVAMGTIRGVQLAAGKNGRVHVVWFGSEKTGVKGPEGSAPLLYARTNDAGTAFEPERNLMQATTALDGGPSIAADTGGRVFVAWQAGTHKGQREGERRLWLARSADEGKTFSRETPAWQEPTGACPCCSVKAFADRKGGVQVLYRMAANRTQRDMVLLTSADQGRTFTGARIDPWPVDT